MTTQQQVKFAQCFINLWECMPDEKTETALIPSLQELYTKFLNIEGLPNISAEEMIFFLTSKTQKS